MKSTASLSRFRPSYVEKLQQLWVQHVASEAHDIGFLALVGPSGSGKLAALQQWNATYPVQDKLFIENGGKLTDGYFAGFYAVFLSILAAAEAQHADIIQRHEQSLKRLFPFVPCSAYKIPMDLTNTATPDERTRFYHHEYQEKLLHGVYEFFLDYCQTTNSTFLIVIDNAHDISPTLRSFLRIIGRRKQLSAYFHIILLSDQPLALVLAPYCRVLPFEPLDLEEATHILHASPQFAGLPPKKIEQYWLLSQGNCARFIALLACYQLGIDQPAYLSDESYFDFYLSLKGEAFKYQLLEEYIEGHCTSDDPLVKRNYENFQRDIKSALHQKQIEKLQQQNTGEQYMRLIHYVSLQTMVEQLEAVSPVIIKLQEIGLYDTWFDMFSHYFNEMNLRILPNGDQLHNVVFIRMAFILYSLGLSKLSVPYLDLFYYHFPESLFVPTVLYSQSMTYGRYQIPVDLVKADQYAMLNLEKIDTIFKDHPKHVYIKVFAENALAYIRARQGRFEEALRLCTEGIHRMIDIYGNKKYALHQSILVYNTGQVYEIIGDFEKAVETYKRSIELDPYYGEYYNDLANLYQKYHHYDDALHYYQKAIDLCPPYYEAHLNRANLYRDTEEFEKAEADYLRVLELKPDEALASLGLGCIFLSQGEYDRALSMLDAAIYHNPKEAQAYNNRALVYMEYDKRVEAQADLDMAIRLAPKLSEAWNNRAILFFKHKQYRECQESIDQAIALTPDPDYFLNRGILFQEMHKYSEAMQDFNYVKEHGQLTAEVEDHIQQVQIALADQKAR